MATRPTFIDTRSQSHGPLDSGQSFLKPLPSPRFHVAGDVPPELSPLDAFAAQSRLLAKQLEDSRSDGKRLSRLPPLSLQNSLDQPRPSFVRSISAHDGMFTTDKEGSSSGGVQKTDIGSQPFRPVSIHPRMSGVPIPGSRTPHSQMRDQDEEQLRGRRLGSTPDFGARREQSPTQLEPEIAERRPINTPSSLRGRPSVDSIQKPNQSPRRQHNPRDFDPRALAPPRSPFAQQRTPSMRSISIEDSDDDYASMGASLLSQSRKFSSSSGLSTSPISPQMNAVPRSPSVSSDFSVGGSRLSRPTFNFSRPLSRASEFTPDAPVRQASSDSQPSLHAEDAAHTPASLQSDDLAEGSQGRAAPSYVYSRFSLPRGKIIQRDSKISPESHLPAEFRWELPKVPQSNVQPYQSGHTSRPSTPPSRVSTSSLRKMSSTEPRESSSLSRSFNDQSPAVFPGSKFEEVQDSMTSSDRPYTSPSLASGSTVKARSQNSAAPSSEGSAEDHLAKGIECHERGSLNESTYHLRIAARQGHPTGMLLYALACRHGWGMRPNQREGVEWLRKAADCAIQEVSGDEDLMKEGGVVDVAAQKTRKAQFALSIYELGVSHMNGWGIEQDKVLALRCFEIAGAWGDGDALAEAGFCYAQGVGCKKDLKKSAKFYRMAESRGISMVGNSWIYKSKYKEDGEGKATPEDSPEKKPGRSRARSMFGRKRPPV